MSENAAPGIRVKIPRRATYNFRISIKNKKSRAAYNLTGFECKVDVKTAKENGTTVFSIGTLSSGITISDPTNGRAECSFTPTQTALFEVGSYYYFDARFDNGTDVLYTPTVEVQPVWTGTDA